MATNIKESAFVIVFQKKSHTMDTVQRHSEYLKHSKEVRYFRNGLCSLSAYPNIERHERRHCQQCNVSFYVYIVIIVQPLPHLHSSLKKTPKRNLLWSLFNSTDFRERLTSKLHTLYRNGSEVLLYSDILFNKISHMGYTTSSQFCFV